MYYSGQNVSIHELSLVEAFHVYERELLAHTEALQEGPVDPEWTKRLKELSRQLTTRLAEAGVKEGWTPKHPE